ncbi:hypothetical protein [Shewanella sp.]|uniref:hypothetical protein n=1 Tax=Shewanella sp. TaxID=50422 RepID=UPI002587B2AE|nr:hypothetical protein [Shewanella sp.]MCJ8302777.1 hypothetical protein [Shewanella sp.]
MNSLSHFLILNARVKDVPDIFMTFPPSLEVRWRRKGFVSGISCKELCHSLIPIPIPIPIAIPIAITSAFH